MNTLPFCRRLARPALTVALAACLTWHISAKDTPLNYLAPGNPDAISMLPPPPPVGSPEQQAELDEVRAVYHAATDADKAAAFAEKKFSVFNFTPAVGAFFTPDNLPKTTAFFARVQADAAKVTDAGKDFFNRPRPFMTDTNLQNGKLEQTLSYPSGHSSESMVLALVLTGLVPDKQDAIIAHARQMGWHRIQIARHYPSDIYAGRVLAMAIVREMKKSPQFQADFAAAQAEITAAAQAAKN